jgi:hypothetical protein
LKKDIADLLEVEIDAEADVDSVDDASDRAIEMPRRLVLYRVALESLQAFAAESLEACSVTLRRGPEGVWLAVKGHGDVSPPEGLEAATIAIEAYGGSFVTDVAADALEIVAQLPATADSAYVRAHEDLSEDVEGQERDTENGAEQAVDVAETHDAEAAETEDVDAA